MRALFCSFGEEENMILEIISALILGIAFWAIFLWVPSYNTEKWSNWMPAMVNGIPGFEHYKITQGLSDDMTRENRIISIKTAQFIPLSQFIGKGFKPVTLEEWQKLYAQKKPYKWRLSKHQKTRRN